MVEIDASFGKQYFERQLPDPAIRRKVLTSLADAIETVNRIAPSSWGLNKRGSLQFTYKSFATAFIWWSQDWQTPVIRYHLDCDDLEALSRTERSILTSAGELETNDPTWCQALIPFPIQEPALQLVHRLLELYISKQLDNPDKVLIKRCQASHRKYGAGYIEYLREFLQRPDLPQPKWYTETLNTQNRSAPMGVFDTIENYLAAKGYFFTPVQIESFYTALQTKGFVILSGISGTGKTKLAQEFARLLPQPEGSTAIPDDIIRIKIQPYMHKYRRMIIPKAWVKLFNPPAPGTSVPVHLEFGGQKGICLLSHYQGDSSNYIQLLLKEKAAAWFLKNFPIHSEIGLEMKFNADGALSGFRLATPEEFAQPDTGNADNNPQNHLFLSVRPDWRDSKSLLGYYNPLTRTYQTTPFVDFLLKAKESYDKKDGLAWFFILDEMNLARVEYYFADLLSVLESGRDDEGYTIEAVRFDNGDMEAWTDQLPEEVHLPPNLYIVGTVNVDETTQSFSPKVLDRAFSIEFTEVDFQKYRSAVSAQHTEDWDRDGLLKAFTRNGRFAQIDKDEIKQFVQNSDDWTYDLQTLIDSLQPYTMHFGYRVYDEIMAFLMNAEENGMDDGEAFDQAILMKVLPKFHGSRGKLERPLRALLRWCASVDNDDADPVKSALANPEQPIAADAWQYPATARRALRMLQSLNSTGFASFG